MWWYEKFFVILPKCYFMAVSEREYIEAINARREFFKSIAAVAARLHDVEANQRYGGKLPYSFHLRRVAELTMMYAGEVLASIDDIDALYFGACFHDSIEDARQTYNDVQKIALRFLDAEHALMATEIVYALTNEKGRTRAERACERYYEGIRTTPYAPIVKLADRLANFTYSMSHDADNGYEAHMVEVYRREMPHFLEAIAGDSASDARLGLPSAMLERITALVKDATID